MIKASFVNNYFLIKLEKVDDAAQLDRITQLTTGSQYNFQQKRWWTESFFHQMTWLPAGLWKRVFGTLQKEGHQVELSGIQDFIDKITEDEFSSWVENMSNLNTEKYKELYWWQFQGVISAIKYRFSRNELDTGAGKSLLLWLMAKFLLQRRLKDGRKILIVVNRRSLVKQLVDKDFPDFSSDGYIKCDTVFSGGMKLAQSNVVVGTYQSLKEYDREYFAQFGALIVDECHGALANSIKHDIIGKLKPGVLRYIHGLSATMHDDNSIPGLILESYLGPIMLRVPLKVLQEHGATTPVRIAIMKLLYPKSMTKELWFDEDITNGSKKLHLERAWVHRQFNRLYSIGQTCVNYPGNHVIMVETVEAVRRLQKYLIVHCPRHIVNVIFGATDFNERERIQNLIESSERNIVIATSETLGTGISLKNIHAVHICDGGRSFIKIRQQIGRGVRLHKSKEWVQIFDWADYIFKDPSWPGSRINALARHSDERKRIYDSREIPWKEHELWMQNWTAEEFKRRLDQAVSAQLAESESSN